jgi:prepilin-type N-terminal cleavage/methylation domain-containing protein
MKQLHSNQYGFTLIEMVISIAMFSLIALGVIALVSSVLVDSSKQSRSLANSDQSRKLSFQIMKELRNAINANNGAYPLAVADNQQLTFFSNIDGGVEIERVRYYVSNGKVYRGIIKPTGNPLTYVTGNESSKVVQDDFANGAAPLFYYYPDTYDGTTGSPLVQPVNISQINFIKINLQVYTRTAGSSTDFYTVTAGSAVRSLKTNEAD